MTTRAADADVWLHHVLENGLVKAQSPRVRPEKLSAKFRPSTDPRWKMELSGRLLSLAFDIREYAENCAGDNRSLRFRYLIFCDILRIRDVSEYDVYHTPRLVDPAHSDLAYIGPFMPDNETPTPAIPFDVLKKLAVILDVCDAGDISSVERMRAQ
jgi:hypothetical protein